MGFWRRLLCRHSMTRTKNAAAVMHLSNGFGDKFVEEGFVFLERCTKCDRKRAWFVWPGGRRRMPVDLMEFEMSRGRLSGGVTEYATQIGMRVELEESGPTAPLAKRADKALKGGETV